MTDSPHHIVAFDANWLSAAAMDGASNKAERVKRLDRVKCRW